MPHKWSKDITEADKEIERDHVRIQAIIFELELLIIKRASPAALHSVYQCVIRKLSDHFQREERLIVSSGLLDVEPHQNEHRALLTEITNYQEQLLSGSPEAFGNLVRFLHKWQLGHVPTYDKDFTELLRCGE